MPLYGVCFDKIVHAFYRFPSGHVQQCFTSRRWSDLLQLMEHSAKAALQKGGSGGGAQMDKDKWWQLRQHLSTVRQQVKFAENALAFSFIEVWHSSRCQYSHTAYDSFISKRPQPSLYYSCSIFKSQYLMSTYTCTTEISCRFSEQCCFLSMVGRTSEGIETRWLGLTRRD